MAPPRKKELTSIVETVPDIDRCIQTAISEKTFSGAACIASVGGRVFHRGVYGCPATPPPIRKLGFDAVFDLASLTKPLATGLAAMVLASRGRIDLGASVAKTIPELREPKFAPMTIDMILDHTAGFPATTSSWEELAAQDKKRRKEEQILGTRKATPFFKKVVKEARLEHEPGAKVLYSDIGFMVLGWIIENIVQLPLDVYLQREVFRELGVDKELFFVRLDEPPAKVGPKRTFVATEQSEWRDKLLQGEVHDPVAWALGGVAGHAGLFGTVDGVWKLVFALWESYHGTNRAFLGGPVRRFWTRSKRVRGSTRTLAWDTPSAHGSMAGKRFSLNSVGHLGFTGCSIWVDLATDVMGIVLTNSAHPTPEGKQEAMAKFRPRLYELIAKHGEALPPDPDKLTGAAAFHGPSIGGAGYNPLNVMRGPRKG